MHQRVAPLLQASPLSISQHFKSFFKVLNPQTKNGGSYYVIVAKFSKSEIMFACMHFERVEENVDFEVLHQSSSPISSAKGHRYSTL